MCVGDTFDGAANKSGVYNGLQALLKQVCPSELNLFTWNDNIQSQNRYQTRRDTSMCFG
jgi:hypothetical protein